MVTFISYAPTVQNVENFFGNVKNVLMNTYYKIEHKHFAFPKKAAIRNCLENMSEHPDVPPISDDGWNISDYYVEDRTKSIYTRYNEDIWKLGIDDLKYAHRNKSGS